MIRSGKGNGNLKVHQGETQVAAEGGHLKRKKFFVIEDDPDHQIIAKMTLHSAGISDIRVFGTGEEAMEYFESSSPESESADSVILIDLMLPKISGVEILKKLRGNESWRAARKVVLTCSTSPADRARCDENGADAFLSKPLRQENVQEILSSLE